MKYFITFVAAFVIGAIVQVMLLQPMPADAGGAPASNATAESNQITERIRDNVPVPQLTTSSERKNVAKRAELFNNEEKISYIYLVDYGKVMAYYTIQGKVSSLQSYMTPTEKLVLGDGANCYRNYTFEGNYEPCYTVGAPDIDGTYGENVEGIFFFTTDGAYVEWRGNYMMSDQPLKLTTTPELIRVIE